MIALFTNPRLLFGGLAVVALLAAYQAGGTAERKRGEAQQLRVELETVHRDAAIAVQAADSAGRKTAELNDLSTRQEEELDALRRQLAARPYADRSRAPADALDRLYPGK